MPKNKKPRKAYRPKYRGEKLSEQQKQELMMPIQIGLSLLPLGHFQEEHAHRLAAFLTTAQVMAKQIGRPDIIGHGSAAAEVLLAMKERVDAGEAWSITEEEAGELYGHMMIIDPWIRQRTDLQWIQAIDRTVKLCDRAAARGQKELTIMTEH